MNRVCSIFSQMLQLISRLEFETAVRKHRAERHARGFSSWGQFVAMLFCQLGHAQVVTQDLRGPGRDGRKTAALGITRSAPSVHPGIRQ